MASRSATSSALGSGGRAKPGAAVDTPKQPSRPDGARAGAGAGAGGGSLRKSGSKSSSTSAIPTSSKTPGASAKTDEGSRKRRSFVVAGATPAEYDRAELLYEGIVGKQESTKDEDTLSVDTSFPDPLEEQRYQDWKTNVVGKRRHCSTTGDDPMQYRSRYDFPKYHRNACLRLRHDNAVTKILTAIVHDRTATGRADKSVEPRLRQDLTGVLQYLRSRLVKTKKAACTSAKGKEESKKSEEATSPAGAAVSSAPAAKRRKLEAPPIGSAASMPPEGTATGEGAASSKLALKTESESTRPRKKPELQPSPALEQPVAPSASIASASHAPPEQAAVSSTAEGGIPGCVHCNLQSMTLPPLESHWICMNSQNHNVPATGACAAPDCPRCERPMTLQPASSSRGQRWICSSGSMQCPTKDVLATFAPTTSVALAAPASSQAGAPKPSSSSEPLSKKHEAASGSPGLLRPAFDRAVEQALRFFGFRTTGFDSIDAIIKAGPVVPGLEDDGFVAPVADDRSSATSGSAAAVSSAPQQPSRA